MFAGNYRSRVAAHINDVELFISMENMPQLLYVIGLLGEVSVGDWRYRFEDTHFMAAVAAAFKAGGHEFHKKGSAAARATNNM